MDDDLIRRQDLTRSILAYLTSNPNAQDSLEGIARWWILSQKIRYYIEEVETVLDKLAADGFVTVVTEADSKVLYRLNSGRDKDIKVLLAKSDDEKQ